MTSIQQLPQELIILIMHFADASCIAKLAATCKSLNAVCNSEEADIIWSNLVFTNVPHLYQSSLNPRYKDNSNDGAAVETLATTITKYSPFVNWKHLAFTCTLKILVLGNDTIYLEPIMDEFNNNLKFAKVDLWDVAAKGNKLPSRSDFNKYATVMIVGDSGSFIDQKNCMALGDTCVEYLEGESSSDSSDSSGGIVLCSFSHNSNVSTGFITGKFKTRDYFPLMPDSQASLPNMKHSLEIDMIDDNHFINMGVDKVTITSDNYDATLGGVNEKATLLAQFSNSPANTPAVAELQVPLFGSDELTNKSKQNTVIAFNLFPYFKDVQLNLGTMVLNALLYAGRNSTSKSPNK